MLSCYVGEKSAHLLCLLRQAGKFERQCAPLSRGESENSYEGRKNPTGELFCALLCGEAFSDEVLSTLACIEEGYAWS